METGKTYLTRSQEKITIINTEGYDNSFPIVGLDSRKRLHKFTRKGEFVGKNFPHQMDLIKEL